MSENSSFTDLIHRVWAPDEQATAELCPVPPRLGRSRVEIAAETSGNPCALRIRFARALDRVAQQMRLEE